MFRPTLLMGFRLNINSNRVQLSYKQWTTYRGQAIRIAREVSRRILDCGQMP